jgi:hypothetical protein
VVLFDVATGTSLQRLRDRGSVNRLGLTRGGALWTSADEGYEAAEVTLWDADRLGGHKLKVAGFGGVVSDDGSLVAVRTFTGSLRIYDADTRRILVHGPEEVHSFSIHFLNSESLLTAGDDGALNFWDFAAPREAKEAKTEPEASK